MSIMVTGGAGYIGAHVVRTLRGAGHDVVVVDDLSTGVASRIGDVPLVELDLAAPDAYERLSATVREHAVDGVVHLAAKKQVGESVARPEYYREQNVGGLTTLLAALRDGGVDRFVFSSSAAVYGEPPSGLVGEDDQTRPINPYGETKLAGERLMAAAGAEWGLRHVALRYFNVAGAGAEDLGDPAVLNLVTIVLDLLEQGRAPMIFGADYPTPDGTCIRDYVHVQDLAEAHVAALDYLDSPERKFDVFNVGTGTGGSVREVLDAVRRATGNPTEAEIVDRRPGDPAELVARVGRIAQELGWTARFGLDDAVESAWRAWRHDRAAGLEPIRAAR
jgi:UDP-glucose 4-epimerase